VGEAIAVAQVIGAFNNGISWNLFSSGNTLAAQIALEYQSAVTNLDVSSLFYLGLILLVFSLVVNLLAQTVVRRVARRQGVPAR
jgi:phosphate transport system permease protein